MNFSVSWICLKSERFFITTSFYLDESKGRSLIWILHHVSSFVVARYQWLSLLTQIGLFSL